MPTAPVNKTGAVIHYEDSGAPKGSSDYLTIVIVHGLVFHSRVFLNLFSHAASYNLRIVALNLRDYPGSTHYTPSELELLCSSDLAKQEVAVRLQGLEIATFLKNFIEAENIPRIGHTAGKKTGGVAVMSWSLGNVWTSSMFGNTLYLDEESKTILLRSLRTWIIYDPPHFPFGIPLPDQIYFPIRDETLPLEQRGIAFRRWVSAFWSPLSEPTEDADVLAARTIVYDETHDPSLRPTTDDLSAEELADMTTPDVMLRSGVSLFTTQDKVWWDNAERALCDTDSAFRHVNALLLWCDMSPAPCPLGTKHATDRVREASARGRATRDVKVIGIERANHFIHYLEPERFLQILTENL